MTQGGMRSPRFIELHRRGELRRRAAILQGILSDCRLCPRECCIDRLSRWRGVCNAPALPQVSAFFPHVDSRDPLSGEAGSGTILFTHCSLRCAYCNNCDISQNGDGTFCTAEDLAEIMLLLQGMGCVNINLVTPTHVVPSIVDALDAAAAAGLRIPIVYSTGGWERVEILRLLENVVDIYRTDFKYASGAVAGRLSSAARRYPERARCAIREMHRQTGVARPDNDGIIRSGLLIDHLILPNDVGGSKEVLSWIAENLPRDSYVRLLHDYTPANDACRFPEILRGTTDEECLDALRWGRESGLENLVLRQS
jgi:putative pyruvate formate lyase activating enzyme